MDNMIKIGKMKKKEVVYSEKINKLKTLLENHILRIILLNIKEIGQPNEETKENEIDLSKKISYTDLINDKPQQVKHKAKMAKKNFKNLSLNLE